jgi:predicted RNase H-like nuclease (RuvC/YqgF family)
MFDEAYVRKLREESAGYRKRAQEAEAKVRAVEEKDLSEREKLQRRVEELETHNRNLEGSLRSADVISQAARAGAVNPAMVAKLVDKEAEDVGQAIAAIKKECPQLFRPPAGSANGGAATGAGSAAPPKEGMNFLIRQAAGRG